MHFLLDTDSDTIIDPVTLYQNTVLNGRCRFFIKKINYLNYNKFDSAFTFDSHKDQSNDDF